jgi:hypothetical protein
VCPETAASLPRSRCGGPLYLLICIKPLDAFTSGAERLQSELVQTFLSQDPLGHNTKEAVIFDQENLHSEVSS